MLTLQIEGVAQPEALPHLAQTTTQQKLQLSPFLNRTPNLTLQLWLAAALDCYPVRGMPKLT